MLSPLFSLGSASGTSLHEEGNISLALMQCADFLVLCAQRLQVVKEDAMSVPGGSLFGKPTEGLPRRWLRRHPQDLPRWSPCRGDQRQQTEFTFHFLMLCSGHIPLDGSWCFLRTTTKNKSSLNIHSSPLCMPPQVSQFSLFARQHGVFLKYIPCLTLSGVMGATCYPAQPCCTAPDFYLHF